MTELTPMQSVTQKVEQHIKDKFAELIPEEVYHNMVQTVADKILKNELQTMIENQLREHTKAKIQEVLNSDTFKQHWIQNEYVSKGMHNIVVEAAPQMLGKIFQSIAFQLFQNMR